MPLSAHEQYLLELINRGRLDPAAEAARYGIDLNAGLAAGTISTAPKQVLAPNDQLENAAIGHSKWMLSANTFSHTGQNGSTLGSRVTATGYQWNTLGENIAMWGVSGTLNLTDAINAHHRGLFLSSGHRTNLMNNGFSEIGIAQEVGSYKFPSGSTLNTSMLTEDFGAQSGKKFLTGVVYNDTNGDNFYTVGEAGPTTTFLIQGVSGTSTAAGGYSVAVTSVGHTIIEGKVGQTDFSALVNFQDGNVKLDIVNGNTFLTSATLTIGHGVLNAQQLGIANINLAGNGLANWLGGNSGSNWIHGYAGNDTVFGNAGNDTVVGGAGQDMLFGGTGSDWLEGETEADFLRAGTGNDIMIGGQGGDQFVFANGDGADYVADFSVSQGDKLMICWNFLPGGMTPEQIVSQYARVTEYGVVFDFGDGDMITLNGVTSTAGLAGAILVW